MTTNIENQALVIAERAFRKEFGDAPIDLEVKLNESLGVTFRSEALLSIMQAESESALVVNDPAGSARAIASKMKHDFVVELRRLADSLEGKYVYGEN